MEVVVLRLGHRPERDQRVTTHVGLLSRALGAKGMYLPVRTVALSGASPGSWSSGGGIFLLKTRLNGAGVSKNGRKTVGKWST